MARISKLKAAKFNVHALIKLQAAIEKDPEIDLTAKLLLSYSASNICYGEDDIRTSICLSDSAEIIFFLSDTVQSLFGMFNSAEMQPKVVWKEFFACQKMAVRNLDDTTEYIILVYLYQRKLNIAAPKPFSLIRLNDILLIFITYLHSTTLAEVWPSLTTAQKISIKKQLILILNDLRSLPYETGNPFGEIRGEGCKDIRRHLQQSSKPIVTVDEFEDFLFSSNRAGGGVFVELLRQLFPKYSGYYSEYYEAIRCINCMASYEENDWYLFIPDCVLSKRYMDWWLLDRAREVRDV
ncbi:uncharacterized protein BO72DRAFT_515681 [Aspergillus fijiensis CBS 313.89]|uniref:Uncharacterized protein n=1 Tax=Aspergillus fijiensis CBS 313.89 TaxID=1448319 RepID=A0A8G1VZ05_9EURO|nr:uncharacterized protein BO72DRAFT_515681 [Aspergillus fijiensis CBS 313.89]RAK74524.1 hypothetical protein BO72DRAFT_515681 [Aspergillus fijiensis CBS 313.89]